MLTTACTQKIQWLGIRLHVPEDWQIVRHSLSPQRGQIVLIDRYRQRMQLGWTQVKDEPDLDRMVEDYRSKQLAAQEGARIDDLPAVGDWRGTHRRFGGSELDVIRAVRYDEPTKRLLEVVLLADEGDAADQELVRRVLASITAVEPADAVTHWVAFGLDVTLPAQWRMTSLDARPADVVMRFEHYEPAKDRPTGAVAEIRRRGMADAWYDGDAEAFLAARAPHLRDPRSGIYDGRSATVIEGIEAGPRLKRMLGLLRKQQDVVWACAGCNAVYHVSVLKPANMPLQAADLRVACGSEHK